jgi:serine/threonine protein phosphatase PrpC
MSSPRRPPAGNVAALSHIGLVRDSNEDAVCIAGDGRLLVCADGLGGLPYGEVASGLAIAHVVGELSQEVEQGAAAGRGGWPERLRRVFLGAHEAILAAGRERGVASGIGTTLIVAVTTARRAHLCHVGDVRGYHWSRGQMERLTDDHSVVFEAVRRGTLSVEQARRHPQRNFVTQALGLPEGIVPSTTTVAMAAADLLLLCTDGLWETMSERELAASLDGERSADAIAESLIERAMAAGGPDNASLVLYRHGAAG